MCIKASSASCPNPGFDYVYTAPAQGQRCTYLTLTELLALSKPPHDIWDVHAQSRGRVQTSHRRLRLIHSDQMSWRHGAQ